MFLFSKKKYLELKSFAQGKLIPIESVNDPVFSNKMMGEGVAIKPIKGLISAPIDAIVEVVFANSYHAIGIKHTNGLELLLHCGLDTVNLTDGTFKPLVKQGDHVKAGQQLLQFDLEKLRKNGYDDTIICVITNKGNFKEVEFEQNMETIIGESNIGKAFY